MFRRSLCLHTNRYRMRTCSCTSMRTSSPASRVAQTPIRSCSRSHVRSSSLRTSCPSRLRAHTKKRTHAHADKQIHTYDHEYVQFLQLSSQKNTKTLLSLQIKQIVWRLKEQDNIFCLMIFRILHIVIISHCSNYLWCKDWTNCMEAERARRDHIACARMGWTTWS